MSAEWTPDLEKLLSQAREHEVALCEVDEAELMAVGWVPPSRGPGTRPFEGTGVVEGGERLVQRGLAVRTDTDAVTAAGPLLDYVTLVSSPQRIHVGSWLSYVDPPGRGVCYHRRVTPLRDRGVAVVERADVPEDQPGDQPVPITIVVLAVETLIDELTELAWRQPASPQESEAGGSESIYLGPDRTLANLPSVLNHQWGAERAVLTWRTLSIFARRAPGDWLGRSRQVYSSTKPKHYRIHLRRRLAAPEPPLRGA